MKATIVNFKDLNPDCWSAKRACHQCHRCDRYEVCKHKIPNQKYDGLINAARAYDTSAADLRRQAREVE